MSYPITGMLVKMLTTLWLMLVLSQVGESQGSGLKLGRFKSPGSADAPEVNHPSENSYNSYPTPRSDKGNLPKGNRKNKSPNYSPSPSTPSGLQVGFYKGKCPNKIVDVEATITAKVQEQFRKDPTILPALLRLQFHDCFVHGCDASILINGNSTERTAGPNLTVRGYELIDALKAAAEAECPDVVSCSDIIAIATKEVVKMGGGPNYLVQTGRRDGVVSRAEDVDLPGPFLTVPETISAFNAKKFNTEEMVILLGCHSVGISHCEFFQDRLRIGTIEFDPLMDSSLREELMHTCPQGPTPSNNTAFLDQNLPSSNTLDNSFFDQILKQRGILSIDQALARHPATMDLVEQFAESVALFNSKLASAMVKLQALDVLTGNQGQIRKVCSRIN